MLSNTRLRNVCVRDVSPRYRSSQVVSFCKAREVSSTSMVAPSVSSVPLTHFGISDDINAHVNVVTVSI